MCWREPRRELFEQIRRISIKSQTGSPDGASSVPSRLCKRSVVRTLRRSKVYHIAVFLEHVDLLDRLDGLHVHLLECGLQFLVVCAGALVHFLRLAAGGTFASVHAC